VEGLRIHRCRVGEEMLMLVVEEMMKELMAAADPQVEIACCR
jgi:hypothetical protein